VVDDNVDKVVQILGYNVSNKSLVLVGQRRVGGEMGWWVIGVEIKKKQNYVTVFIFFK
jgi:hypothetical protein